jgi:ribonuclease HI
MSRQHRKVTRRRPSEDGTDLKVVQFNANGVVDPARKAELVKFLADNAIDVALVQETNLGADAKFDIPGYEIRRRERVVGRTAGANTTRGGVMTLIREGLDFIVNDDPILAPADNTTEVLSVTIITGESSTRLINIYVPPIRGGEADQRTQNFDPEFLPRGRRVIVAGDINGHSPAWDEGAPTDKIGEKVEDWLVSANFAVLNDGNPTRTNPATGKGSAPDVTLCHNSIRGSIKWSIGQDCGSDHLPIVFNVPTQRWNETKRGRGKRWIFKKAKWDVFREEIEKRLPDHRWENMRVNTAQKTLCSIMLAAAHKAIPKGCRPGAKVWWNDEAEKVVEARKESRKKAADSEEERLTWLEAESTAKTTIRECKRSTFREMASSLDHQTDSRKVWSLIHALDGQHHQAISGEAIEGDGKLLTNDKAKANAFMAEFSNVSHIHCTKEERKRERGYTDEATQPCREAHGEGPCAEFSAREFNDGLKQLKHEKAAGPDLVSNEMLHQLPESAKAVLLTMLNKSWTEKSIPGIWRRAKITPVQKRGKPADQIGSYRPISLTSNISKLMERLVKTRLQFWLESNNKLNTFQAGFRAQRSTQDQVMRIVQSIADNFQNRKKTAFVLIDYSRAFDMVWRPALYHKMAKMGIPGCFIQWVRQFLCDRTARVTINNTAGASRRLLAGVPQGAVLSPLLFLIYINDAIDSMPSGVHASLFADDLALWTGFEHTKEAEGKSLLQRGLDCLEEWSHRWKMKINASKCESILFSKDPGDSQKVLNFTLCNEDIPFNPTPTFLGVVFDRTLSFGPHIANVKDKMKKRLNTLRALTGTSWGCQREDLRILYVAFVRSVMEYCGGAWMSSAPDSHRDKLQVVENEAARIITGCTKSTPQEQLTAEAGFVPVKTRMKQLSALAYEKALRVADDNPIRAAAHGRAPQRLPSVHPWREIGSKTSSKAGLNGLPRQTTVPVNNEPWRRSCNTKFDASLNKKIKRTDPAETRKLATEEMMNNLPECAVRIFTDGSAEEGVANGGSGVLIQCREPQETVTIARAAGRWCSSYLAETKALLLAMEWIKDNADKVGRGEAVQIFTDSKSAVDKLQAGPAGQVDYIGSRIWRILMSEELAAMSILVCWIPSHCGVEGNETVDRLANDGRSEPQLVVEIDYPTSKALIIRTTTNRWKTKTVARAGRILALETNWEKERVLSRLERRTLAQMRSHGHCPYLNAYRQRIGLRNDDICDFCLQASQTAEHIILTCPALDGKRRRHLGNPGDLGVLAKDPARVAAFLGEVGFLTEARRQ